MKRVEEQKRASVVPLFINRFRQSLEIWELVRP